MSKEYYEIDYGVYYGSSKTTFETHSIKGVYAYSREEAKEKAIKAIIKDYEDRGYEKVLVHSVF